MNAVSNVSDILTPSYPDLPLARELDDALVPVPLLLVADGADPGHSIVMRHVTRDQRDTCDTSPDDHVDVVPVHVGAVPRPLGPHRPVGGLGEGTRAAGAANKSIFKCDYEYTEIFTIKCENTVGLWIRSKQMAHISTL